MSVFTMAFVATIAAVAAVAMFSCVVLVWLCKQLHGQNPIEMFISMGHQHVLDNTWREHNFQIEQQQLKEIAEEQRKQRTQKAEGSFLDKYNQGECVYNQRDYR